MDELEMLRRLSGDTKFEQDPVSNLALADAYEERGMLVQAMSRRLKALPDNIRYIDWPPISSLIIRGKVVETIRRGAIPLPRTARGAVVEKSGLYNWTIYYPSRKVVSYNQFADEVLTEEDIRYILIAGAYWLAHPEVWALPIQ